MAYLLQKHKMTNYVHSVNSNSLWAFLVLLSAAYMRQKNIITIKCGDKLSNDVQIISNYVLVITNFIFWR